MPLQILDGETPTPPPWGSILLEIYVLSEWETPHPSHPTESPSDRRRRLVRQFLALGYEGREPYRALADSPPTPTEAQIAEILLPLRPEALRPYAAYTGSLGESLWLRLCYDLDKEEVHESLRSANEDYDFVGPDGVILDDKTIFSGLDLAAAVELFPERITNEGVNVQRREKILREMLSDIKEDTGSGEEDYSDEVKEMLARLRAPVISNPLLRYSRYHAACVVTHVFVEDEKALDGAGLLHVFLDDCGNVVRQWRVEEGGVDDCFDGCWAGGNWEEFFISGMGEVGSAYREGGMRGPPYDL